MPDVVKTKNVLSLVAEFSDGDDRTLNLDNPTTIISAAGASAATAINAVGTYVKNNSILLGDKDGAAFTRFKSAKVTTGTTTYLDI